MSPFAAGYRRPWQRRPAGAPAAPPLFAAAYQSWSRAPTSWLGRQDSNLNTMLQRHVSYHWTTPQCLARRSPAPAHETRHPRRPQRRQARARHGGGRARREQAVLGRAAARERDSAGARAPQRGANLRKVRGKRTDDFFEVVLDSGTDNRPLRADR